MTWISKGRAAALTNNAIRTIDRMVASGKLRSKLAPHLSSNNKRPTLVCLEDLGSEAVRRYFESAPAAAPSPAAGPPAPPALADPHSPDPPTSERPAWAVEVATRRQALIERVLARCAEAPRARTGIVREAAAAAGLSTGTLYRYLRAHALRGFDGLLPAWGRPPNIEPAVQDFVRSQYLDPRQTLITDIYDRTVDFCLQIKRPAPSYRTVVRVCTGIDPAAVTYHRLGRKAWAQTYEPILRRDYSDLAVGEMWCGDHRELDVFVRVGDAKYKRPWFTAWMDLRSRMIVGGHLSFAPTARTIALAFRDGVLACGRPGFVYIDNGKDYKSHDLNGREKLLGRVQFDAETKGVFGRLNAAVIHAKPYAARSKPIERWFGTLSQHFDRQQPGWCGRDNKQRPEKLKGEIARNELLTLEELHRRLFDYIAHYNTEVEHSELGCAPAALWADATKEVPDARALDLLMMKATACRVWNDGIHHLTCRFWDSELATWIGRTVDVRYDPSDVRRIIVFAEGRFVCEAVTAELGSMKTGEALIKQKARERKAARERVQRYADDVRVLYSADEAVAIARANARPAGLAASGAAAVGGRVVPLLTGMERAAEVVAPEMPEGDPAPVAAAVNEAWEQFRNSQLEEYEQMRRDRQQAEAAQKAEERAQWRMLGIHYHDQGGGDA